MSTNTPPAGEAPSSDKLDRTEFIVQSKVRVLLREAGMHASADLWDALGHQVTRSVKRAIVRAKANGRKTVRATDV